MRSQVVRTHPLQTAQRMGHPHVWVIGASTKKSVTAAYRANRKIMNTYDIVCVGAGPTGLACAMEAKRVGMRALVIDKGCLCNSIYNYPVNMVFFTTPELLEIGGLPMVTNGDKPTRIEALKYYRKGAEHYGLELRLLDRVLRVDGHDGAFTVVTETESGREEED